MCHEHVQSRVMMQSVLEFRARGQHMLADAFWRIAKHYASGAAESYAVMEREKEPA